MNFGIHYRSNFKGYDIVLYPGRWSIQIDQKDLNQYKKSAAIITSLAVAILSSAYLSGSNPTAWWTAYQTIWVVNLYLLPKILHYGNVALIKAALITNLAVLSTSTLGILGAEALSTMSLFASSIYSFQSAAALLSAYWLTTNLGYFIPFFRESLVKTYQFLNKPEDWEEKILNLKKQFQRLPEMGLGLLQTNLWQNFILTLALISPAKVLDFRLYSLCSCPDYIWSMAAAVSDKLTIDQFKNLLQEMKIASDQIDAENLVNLNLHRQQGIENEEVNLPENLQENFCNRLKFTLRGLNKKDLSEAVLLLLEDGSKLIPQVISNKKFLDLFKNDALDSAETIINEFLKALQPWKECSRKHADLKADILSFEQELDARLEQKNVPAKQKLNAQKYLDQLAPQIKKNLLFQNQRLNKIFNELQKEVEKIYKWTRIWKYLAPLWNNLEVLPFENGPHLLATLQNQNLFLEIDETYQDLVSLREKRQRLNDLIIPLDDKAEPENRSAYIFLSLSPYDFKVAEFDRISDWVITKLDLSKIAMDELGLEEALAQMGIKTDEDLYSHKILKHDEILNKETVLANLERYIKAAPKPIFNQIIPVANANHNASVSRVSEKVSRFIYYAIAYGRLLVPLLINIPVGAAGFAVGLGYYTLKKFQSNSPPVSADHFLRYLDPGRVNAIHPRSREAADTFTNADFFQRIRIINTLLTPAVLLSSFQILTFLHGLSMAKQLVTSLDILPNPNPLPVPLPN